MMKTIRGESFVLIDYINAWKVWIRAGGREHEIAQISAAEFESIFEKPENILLMGIPTVWCQHLVGSINVWPSPDDEYDVFVEPAPPYSLEGKSHV